MPNTPAVSLRIPVEQKAALDALALKSGHTVSQLIITCIKRSLPVLQEHVDKQLARVNDQP